MKGLRYHITRLTEHISSNALFHAPLKISFRHDAIECSCGQKLKVLKTYPKKIATFEVGEFTARITELQCESCGKIYLPEDLGRFVPHGSKFGYDVIVFVGRSLFLECLGQKQIQCKLKDRNIPISIREIGYLGKKFIIYLALAHRETQETIKRIMALYGGYILHLDGTCEGDSLHLLSALDSITEIVIDNVKLPSENSDQIIPFLTRIKKAYGNPIAMVHDMGRGILKAVKAVFPNVPDFICHFHFLKDIGKDLFGSEYAELRTVLSDKATRSLLRKKLKALKIGINADGKLSECLDSYLKQQLTGAVSKKLPATVTTYLWIQWILNWKTELNGYGFPFDRDYYVFFKRLKVIKKAIESLPPRVKTDSQITQLNSILVSILDDQDLKKNITVLKQKIIMFDKLRKAMQIALPESKKGLNDDGNDAEIKTIKKEVTKFRNSEKLIKAAEKNLGYKKMLKQIDKYWDKLFADPITVTNSKGEKIVIQPQRTNNIMERLFRDLKRSFRKRSGNKALNRTLQTLLSDTPLVRNLENPEYLGALLKGHDTLEERFAEIKVEDVRQELKKLNAQSEIIPVLMKKVLQISDIPMKIAEITKNKAA